MLPRSRIDLVVPDESADSVVDAIAKSVNTGTIGDGKIWVSTVARLNVPCDQDFRHRIRLGRHGGVSAAGRPGARSPA